VHWALSSPRPVRRILGERRGAFWRRGDRRIRKNPSKEGAPLSLVEKPGYLPPPLLARVIVNVSPPHPRISKFLDKRRIAHPLPQTFCGERTLQGPPPYRSSRELEPIPLRRWIPYETSFFRRERRPPIWPAAALSLTHEAPPRKRDEGPRICLRGNSCHPEESAGSFG